MSSKMIVHRRLIFGREVAMIANEFSVTVLVVDKYHLCKLFDAFHCGGWRFSIFAGSRGGLRLKLPPQKELEF
jgi:hypothetical protein